MNAVAFSIYGRDPKYVEGAVRNAERVPEAYPGFTAVFYLDTRTTPPELPGRLRALGAEVRVGDSADGVLPEDRMLWKLLAIDDPTMDVILFRDADSRITRREVAAVTEWLASDKAAHVMRDFPNHACRIGGGLWGVRRSKLPGFSFRAPWEDYKRRHPGWQSEYRWEDQTFLAESVWPTIEHQVVQHDEFSGYPGTVPFPTPHDPSEGFVGEIFEIRDGVDCHIPHHRQFREARKATAHMNPDTRIAVCCYAGDQHQVIKALGNYLQHTRPVVILSPEDSPAIINYPGIENRVGGKRAYIGQESLDRQRKHLEILLTFPENHFLIHDADSICLSAEIPKYLYEEPDFVWSNLVNDDIPEHKVEFDTRDNWPHVAFQPPYFLSRATIEKMLAVAGRPEALASPVMPFVDFYMVQLTMLAGLGFRRFRNCVSCSDHPSLLGWQIMTNQVRDDGVVIVHSVKRHEIYLELLKAREDYLRAHP